MPEMDVFGFNWDKGRTPVCGLAASTLPQAEICALRRNAARSSHVLHELQLLSGLQMHFCYGVTLTLVQRTKVVGNSEISENWNQIVVVELACSPLLQLFQEQLIPGKDGWSASACSCAPW